MNTKIKLTKKEKEQFVAGARIAEAIPGEQQFWREVETRLDKYVPEVAPRPGKQH